MPIGANANHGPRLSTSGGGHGYDDCEDSGVREGRPHEEHRRDPETSAGDVVDLMLWPVRQRRQHARIQRLSHDTSKSQRNDRCHKVEVGLRRRSKKCGNEQDLPERTSALETLPPNVTVLMNDADRRVRRPVGRGVSTRLTVTCPRPGTMRILIIDTCYPAFLRSHYRSAPSLAQASYLEQWRALMDTFFGTADAYLHNLARARPRGPRGGGELRHAAARVGQGDGLPSAAPA